MRVERPVALNGAQLLRRIAYGCDRNARRRVPDIRYPAAGRTGPVASTRSPYISTTVSPSSRWSSVGIDAAPDSRLVRAMWVSGRFVRVSIACVIAHQAFTRLSDLADAAGVRLEVVRRRSRLGCSGETASRDRRWRTQHQAIAIPLAEIGQDAVDLASRLCGRLHQRQPQAG